MTVAVPSSASAWKALRVRGMVSTAHRRVPPVRTPARATVATSLPAVPAALPPPDEEQAVRAAAPTVSARATRAAAGGAVRRSRAGAAGGTAVGFALRFMGFGHLRGPGGSARTAWAGDVVAGLIIGMYGKSAPLQTTGPAFRRRHGDAGPLLHPDGPPGSPDHPGLPRPPDHPPVGAERAVPPSLAAGRCPQRPWVTAPCGSRHTTPRWGLSAQFLPQRYRWGCPQRPLIRPTAAEKVHHPGARGTARQATHPPVVPERGGGGSPKGSGHRPVPPEPTGRGHHPGARGTARQATHPPVIPERGGGGSPKGSGHRPPPGGGPRGRDEGRPRGVREPAAGRWAGARRTSPSKRPGHPLRRRSLQRSSQDQA